MGSVEVVEQIGSVVGRRRSADRGDGSVVDAGEDLAQLVVIELEQRAAGLARVDEQRQHAAAVLFDQLRQNRRDVGGRRLVDHFAQLRIRAVPQQLRQQLRRNCGLAIHGCHAKEITIAGP